MMHTLGRIFFLFILAVVWMFKLESAEERERSAVENPGRPRYTAYFPNFVLPIFLGILVAIAPLLDGLRDEKMILALCFSVFLHTSIYYLFLGLAMPLLRRKISSRVCASLWLLPNYLYLLSNDAMTPNAPKWTIYIPQKLLFTLCLVWLAGFLAVLGWKCAEHFRFRRKVLNGARKVEAPDILALWNEELSHAGLSRRKYTLVRSTAVNTPLTIGFWQRTIRVVLPERSYTPEQLRLIFRHELVHIGRDDAGSKFFLVFCTAMCWFNPLMWWAMGKSADDLELSCDETVLLDADAPRRKQYADLLLRTAGDERGFTTCLSASAKAMKYRLHWVIRPQKRFTGSFLAGCILFVLFLSSGSVALAFDKTSGAELIFDGKDPAEFEIVDNDVFWREPGRYLWPEPEQPEALKEYLAGLELYEVTELYDFSDEGRCMDLTLSDGAQNIRLELSDHALMLGGTHWDHITYYFVQDEIDWDYLDGLLVGEK